MLPNDEWARVAVTVGGICGSDLHLFGNRRLRAPALGGFWTFPFLLGHEIAGTRGGGRRAAATSRSARASRSIPRSRARARGIAPVCRMCAAGHASCCLELGSRVMTPGMSIGFTVGLGGGWADQVLAHRSMLHRDPRRGSRRDREPARAGVDRRARSAAQAAPRRRSRDRRGRRDHRARGGRRGAQCCSPRARSP